MRFKLINRIACSDLIEVATNGGNTLKGWILQIADIAIPVVMGGLALYIIYAAKNEKKWIPAATGIIVALIAWVVVHYACGDTEVIQNTVKKIFGLS